MKIKRLLLMLSLAVAIPWVANAQTTPILPQHGEIGNQDASLTTVTQTIALSAGVNWVSTYVNITQDDLKSALAEALGTSAIITIQSRNENIRYTRGRWSGNLSSWDVTLMYKIKVNDDCEIALTGMPINPSEHPITINNGVNWIGFPFSESMTVTNAFPNGFAVNSDVVQSRNGNTRFSRNRWSLEMELEPGKGYIYKSAASEPRILLYQSSGAKTVHNGGK